MNTLATVYEVWVPFVTVLAIATIPCPAVRIEINTYAICSTQVILFVLSSFTPSLPTAQSRTIGSLLVFRRLVRLSEENLNLSSYRLKLYALKLTRFSPSGIGIWQHPIPEQFPSTIFCMFLHLDRQPVENSEPLSLPLRYA